MNSYYAMLALDLADDRAREAREQRLARLAHDGQGDQPSVIRRGLARATAAVSLGAASMTRRRSATSSLVAASIFVSTSFIFGASGP